jgi:glycosyltransferase involved in cell wall biosynthesis
MPGRPEGIVIPNFVDLRYFGKQSDPQQKRESLGIAMDSEVLLYLGGLSEIKGIFQLMEALEVVQRTHPKVKCLMPGSEYTPSGTWKSKLARSVLPMLGGGTLAQRIEKQLVTRKLTTVCVRSRFSQDIAQLFAASHIVLFPALRDHFSRPAVEAGASRRPIIGSRLPTLEEQVENGVTGLLVSPGDPNALAIAITTLLDNPLLQRQMGEAGYRRASAENDATRGINRIMAIYETLKVGGGRPECRPTASAR